MWTSNQIYFRKLKMKIKTGIFEVHTKVHLTFACCKCLSIHQTVKIFKNYSSSSFSVSALSLTFGVNNF